ncbi:hypothetical protein VPH35_073732 [Triticum aestivum]
MEPVVHGRPSSLDVHYPLVPDQNSLVCLVTISPPKAFFLPWLRRVLRHRLGITAVRFAGSAVGDRTIWILSHNTGDNAFRFAYRHVVSLSLEKLPLELWNRRGVAACVAGFASLFRLEHACLHGSEFSSIFVLVKVEALHHIPHHTTFHRVDGNGIYADVIINEIWDVARSLGAPTVTPRPLDRLEEGGADAPAPPSPCRGRAHHGSSTGRGHASAGLAAKPKLIRGSAFSLPSEAQILHEDELRLCLHSSLWAAEVRTPRVSVTFDTDGMCFSFKLELNNSRTASGSIPLLTGGPCPRTLPLLPSVECRHPPKPNVPVGLLPAVGPALVLSGDGPLTDVQFPAQQHYRAHQILVARPICSRPFHRIPRPEPGVLSCVLTAVPIDLDLNKAVEIQPLESGEQGCHGEDTGHAFDQQAAEEELPPILTASPRRSPRISRAYDGVRLVSVEHAAKRKVVAAGSDSSSGPSRWPSSSHRHKKSKTAVVASLLELPLLNTPSPMTRGKLKKIAQCCDLNASAILEQAKIQDVPVLSDDTSASAGAAPASPACVYSSSNV